MSSKCKTIVGDVIAVLIVALVFVGVDLFLFTEKTYPLNPSSGFHLLSCPSLFANRKENGGVSQQKLFLEKEETERLVAALKESLTHEGNVLHVNGQNPPRLKHLSHVVKDYIAESASDGHEIDVNIPSMADNNQICSILEEVSKKQKGRNEENTLVGISLTELNSNKGSLLRGKVKNALSILGRGFIEEIEGTKEYLPADKILAPLGKNMHATE